MANILDILNQIGTAVYGKDVRQAIIDAIRQCYEDGKAGVNDLQARTLIEAVMAVNEQQAAEIEALTARVEELEEGESGGSSETSTTSVPTFLVESGTTTFENVGANKTATQSITFTESFTEAPTVLAIKVFRQGANTFYSQVTAQPIQSSITADGFTLAVGNKYTQAVSPSVLWVAFQPTTVEVETEITTVDGMTEADVKALLAPITAALDSLKIGYDGTEYDTAGASLREQINALHVLMGDEPGTAISASAVAYGDSDVSTELDGVNGRLREQTDAFFPEMTWEIGTITVNGNDNDNTKRGRTNYIPVNAISSKLFVHVTRTTGIGFTLFFYDKDRVFVGKDDTYWSEFVTPETKITIPVDADGYVRICTHVLYDSDITDLMINQFAESFSVYTDENLSKVNAVAKTNESTISGIEHSIVNGIDEDAGEWEQGGINADVADFNSPIRIRTKGSIAVNAGDKITFKANGQRYFWYLLSEDKTVTEKSEAWGTGNTDISISENCYLRVCVSKIRTNDTITPEERTFAISIGTPVAVKMDSFTINGKYGYKGRAIDLTEHSFNADVFLTLPETASIQGSALYGNEIFAFITDRTINVYDIETGELLGNFATSLPESTHGNGFNFAPSLHEGNTQYPYLYVSSNTNQNAFFVLDIQKDTTTGEYSCTLVQTLAFNAVSGDVIGNGPSDCAIDWQNGLFYMLRYKQASYQAVEGNTHVVTCWPLPNVVSGTKLFSADEMISLFKIPNLIYARQQTVYHNGNILFTSGGPGVTGVQRLNVLSIADKSIVTSVDIGDAVEYVEPESIIIHNGAILILTNRAAKIYRLEFVS